MAIALGAATLIGPAPLPAQPLERACLVGDDLGDGLQLAVDDRGVVHLSRVFAAAGSLVWTTVAPGGAVTDEVIDPFISVIGTPDQVRDTGLALTAAGPRVCAADARAERFDVHLRGVAEWERVTLDEGAGHGTTCDIAADGDAVVVAWTARGRLRVARQGGEQWLTVTADQLDGNSVGHDPSIALGADGELAVAHFDESAGTLRISQTVMDGPADTWVWATAVADGGWSPAAVFMPDGELVVAHAVRPSEPDTSSDVIVRLTHGPFGGPFVTEDVPGIDEGGSLDAHAVDDELRLVVRSRTRSALFGAFDGLYLDRGPTEGPLERVTLEEGGPGDRRHGYRFLQITADPFGSPVIALLDEAAPFFGQRGTAQVCLWRAADTDADAIPDAVEAELGTAPDRADTDGDGRTDGQEVLVDGTDPRVDEGGCEPVLEVCNAIDDDCDGQVDEGVAEAADCATGAAGRCGEGRAACVEGQEVCVPLFDARSEQCDGTDDDCDGQVDEGEQSCGLGACAVVLERCANGAPVDCAPEAPPGPDDTCDAVDDDCDGRVDEAWLGAPIVCGVGACRADGVERCVAGEIVELCAPGRGAADDPTCDDVDDDCDGRTDEDAAPTPITCGVGACARAGERRCTNGLLDELCTPGVPAADDGQCDGIDSDCDGRVDEDVPTAPTRCGVGACAAAGQRRCVNGASIDDCTPGPAAPEDATCDALDDDCDGRIDEDYFDLSVCGEGPCRALGELNCVDGQVEDSCRPAAGAPDDPCNGVDDDCDGRVDEDLLPEPTACGVGACASTGTRACVERQVRDDCVPGPTIGIDDTCDSVDDDCDGRVDESAAPSPMRCGVGACHRDGEQVCVDGARVARCTPGQAAPTDATCDGVDEDCDGRVDEDAPVSPTRCGIGACAAQGAQRCAQGRPVDDCTPGAPAPSDVTCDGIDDDCDGLADEDATPITIACPEGACEQEGRRVCDGGVERDVCPPPRAADDDPSCDGIDDDCDGALDEDAPVSPTTCGLGACAADGVVRCVDGAVALVCAEGDPAPDDATCDGVDDDCDGRTDEAAELELLECGVGVCARFGARQCRDGVRIEGCRPGQPIGDDANCDGRDDDCDGQTDEGFAPQAITCGEGPCAVAGLRMCVDGGVQSRCAPGAPAGDDADCDGVDDDCDGSVDEGFRRGLVTCGQGVCAAEGEQRCVEGRLIVDCRPGPARADDPTCNGRDDDCDGRLDEDVVERPTRCGVGACAAVGALVCRGGVRVDTCLEQLDGPDDDCDGADDDCDGAIDEGYAPRPVLCGEGLCGALGETRCTADGEIDVCQPGAAAPVDATCDGIDDDCDGHLDEDFAPREIACGVGACRSTAARLCVEGEIIVACVEGTPGELDATCDGVDDDCDGRTDEDHLAERTTCGAGACLRDGALLCVDGERVPECTPGAPGPFDAVCDGVDADCDGQLDEDYVGPRHVCGIGACRRSLRDRCIEGQVAEVECVPGAPAAFERRCDGVDEDCDGAVDEGCPERVEPDAALDALDAGPRDGGAEPAADLDAGLPDAEATDAEAPDAAAPVDPVPLDPADASALADVDEGGPLADATPNAADVEGARDRDAAVIDPAEPDAAVDEPVDGGLDAELIQDAAPDDEAVDREVPDGDGPTARDADPRDGRVDAASEDGSTDLSEPPDFDPAPDRGSRAADMDPPTPGAALDGSTTPDLTSPDGPPDPADASQRCLDGGVWLDAEPPPLDSALAPRDFGCAGRITPSGPPAWLGLLLLLALIRRRA